MSDPRPVIPRNPTTLVDAETGAPVSADNPLPVSNAELAARIGSPDDEPGDPTVIGLLKQIANNTTPGD